MLDGERKLRRVAARGPAQRVAVSYVSLAQVRWSVLVAVVTVAVSSVPVAAAPTRGSPTTDLAATATADQALPAAPDADGDGWTDTVESSLGSDTADPASAPESVAILASCIDGANNDGDGSTDGSDPGCQAAPIATTAIPAAGTDSFESTISLDDFRLATPLGVCPMDFDGRGPTVVVRGDPVDVGGGLRAFDTEIVAMQLQGTGTLLPGSPCNAGSTPVSFPATIVEDPEHPSTGSVTDTNPDPAIDFPAESFFDVFLLAATPLGLLPIRPPDGGAGDPVRVTNVVNSLPPYHSPGNPSLNPNCYTVAGLPHQHCPKPPLDHFKCYTGTFPKTDARTVMLQDQFGRARTSVRRPDRFCNPVSKDKAPIGDPGAHLKRYLTRDAGRQAPAPVEVIVQNQFGVQDLTVDRPVGLLVPSQKERLSAPVALDHFRCYAVRGAEVGRTVSLVDQFDEQDGRVETAVVGSPRVLCTPTVKSIDQVTTPIGDAASHLVCYAIATEPTTPRSVRVANQFGREIVTVKDPVELCVPSLKIVRPPRVERDVFRGSRLTVHVTTATGEEDLRLAGPTTMRVDFGGLSDSDGDGREEVQTEIVRMGLTGTSTLLGPVAVRLRDGSGLAAKAAGGIEEMTNGTPGILELPPFTSGGVAEGFVSLPLDVDVVIDGASTRLHTCDPLVPTGTITHKPPKLGEGFETRDTVLLCDENDQPTSIEFGPVVFVPSPVIGRLALETSPARVRSGQRLFYTGTGFTPGGDVIKTFVRPDGNWFSLRARANADGIVAGDLHIPRNERGGTWGLIAQDLSTGRQVQTTFQVR